jgi:hypothetical protein
MDERLAVILEGLTAPNRGGRASAGQLGLLESPLPGPDGTDPAPLVVIAKASFRAIRSHRPSWSASSEANRRTTPSTGCSLRYPSSSPLSSCLIPVLDSNA